MWSYRIARFSRSFWQMVGESKEGRRRMSLQFVLGNSGSGKTEYIYRQIVEQAGEHPKQNFLVIVPEQFTMQTQQKLVDLKIQVG